MTAGEALEKIRNCRQCKRAASRINAKLSHRQALDILQMSVIEMPRDEVLLKALAQRIERECS